MRYATVTEMVFLSIWQPCHDKVRTNIGEKSKKKAFSTRTRSSPSASYGEDGEGISPLIRSDFALSNADAKTRAITLKHFYAEWERKKARTQRANENNSRQPESDKVKAMAVQMDKEMS